MCFYDYINISKIDLIYDSCGERVTDLLWFAYRLSLNIYLRRYLFWTKVLYLLRRYLLRSYIYLPSFVKYRPSKVPSYYFTHAFLCVCAWHVQEIQCEKIEILSLLGRPAVSNNERAQPLESKGLTLASFLSQSDGHRRPGSLTLWCLFSLRPYE